MITSKFSTGLEKPTIKKAPLCKNEKKKNIKKERIIVKQIKRPMSYFIHCDLINRNLNFVNNKKSDLLAKIDVKGRPYEKVRYDASPQQPIRDCSTSSHVNSITISVRDQDGELFDFKDMPLEFELDLN